MKSRERTREVLFYSTLHSCSGNNSIRCLVKDRHNAVTTVLLEQGGAMLELRDSRQPPTSPFLCVRLRLRCPMPRALTSESMDGERRIENAPSCAIGEKCSHDARYHDPCKRITHKPNIIASTKASLASQSKMWLAESAVHTYYAFLPTSSASVPL